MYFHIAEINSLSARALFNRFHSEVFKNVAHVFSYLIKCVRLSSNLLLVTQNHCFRPENIVLFTLSMV